MVRLGEIVLIHNLKRQGLSVTAIARQVGLDRKTVRRYLQRGLEPPAYKPREPRPRLIEGFQGYLRERDSAKRLFGRIEIDDAYRCQATPSFTSYGDGVDAPRRHRCAKVAGVEAPL